MNEKLSSVKSQIIASIKAMSNSDLVSEKMLITLIKNYRFWEDNSELNESERILLYEELSNYFIADLNYESDLVQIDRGLVIVDKASKQHLDWQPEIESRFYWKKQREFLRTLLENRNGNEEAFKIINSIHFETETILKNMENPLRSEFDSRGLVVGYVQSGKTANFTALIAKSADAGYRFIIVLAGIHDELRQQTQIRIDRELTGYNNLNLDGDFINWNDLEGPRRWLNLTSAGWLDGKETGEFTGKGINKFSDVFLNRDRPVIAVVKKNVKVLEKVIKWVENSETKDRLNVPLLIIDDEADQASVDGNSNKEETDPTKTNEKIRRILESFQRKAYVGYTATPFANVFIQHDSEHEELGDDLYPRNFIHALPEPTGYFGTKRIFASDLDKLFVKLISDAKLDKENLADKGCVTDNLVYSIYSFLIGIATRNLRGQGKMPMSMMINVDHRVTKMNRIGELIQEFVLKTLPQHLDLNEFKSAYDRFVVDSIDLNKKLNTNHEIMTWESVKSEVVNVLKAKSIKISVLNSNNDDKLDYAKNPSMKVIAVGGNKLSRGLTLEGLMVTYYLRESKTYDTLLQMGRWFGYRRGYEDLVRIYTSETLWNQFRDLAVVELEFRGSIQEMISEEPARTPKEFAIAVRQILGLLPTSKNKLGAAVLENYYGGSQVSVTRLTLEKPEVIDKNNSCVHTLINNVYSNGGSFHKVSSKSDLPTVISKNVCLESIISFLNDFKLAHDEDGILFDFDKFNMLEFIKKNRDKNQFLHWNVAIASVGMNEDDNIIELSHGIKVRAVNRARLKTTPINGVYNIKAISSKSDRVIDLPSGAKNEYEGRTVPLLLIYYVSRNSKPINETENSSREPLYQNIERNAHRDPVAFSIIFPNDNEGSGVFKQKIG